MSATDTMRQQKSAARIHLGKPVTKQFAETAAYYDARPEPSSEILELLARFVLSKREGKAVFADVGAGIGRIAHRVASYGLSGIAVEPDEAMRHQAEQLLPPNSRVSWLPGTAERTGLPEGSVDWIYMANAFHRTDPAAALREFKRILRPGGYFTALWLRRDYENDELQSRLRAILNEHEEKPQEIYDKIYRFIGSTGPLLTESGFEDLTWLEGRHQVTMTREQYLSWWKSIQIIRDHSTAEGWKLAYTKIATELKNFPTLTIRLITQAWTARTPCRNDGVQ